MEPTPETREYRRNDPIPDHRWFNWVTRRLDGPPIEVDASSGLTLSGRVLSLVLPIFVRPALAGGSGIPARSAGVMGSATITLQTFAADGTVASLGKSAIGWNLSAAAVAADAQLLVLKVLGLWVVVWEDCPGS